jgi:hypothetical protein
MFCEYETDKTTPLRIDKGIVQRELERPFQAHLNELVTQNPFGLTEGKTDDILEKLGQKKLPMIERSTPGFVKTAFEKFQKHVQKWELDRLHPITARYLDWK